uniref:UvrABC system protein C n=1 Tax=Solibacter usitatus (strain Ellin6076) TaxID=234267 RepID=UVRC_SOLUE|nr:RecName: Full=UvrABC system protein C; Short=Protein UvrC; AltName: Full=Excinuclease ABC subunit C [Candidatus Solibacter usitatus Ellin6076]
MELRDKVGQLPFSPGVYLYKDSGGKVIYVGKAKSLRNRVRSYFSEDKLGDIKTGTLITEACDIDYILVDNEKEALALENNLIKQYKPRFNILLRDDKTYPYVKVTNEKYPRVYVTRRLRKDGAQYFGPFFPANLAHRLVHFIHRHFQVPSCKVDLTRFHPKPCLQFHIHRCLGPCVQGLTTDEAYAAAVRDVRLFLDGRHSDLARGLRARMEAASLEMRFEEAAGLRDLITTVEEIEERQKMAAAKGDDVDIFAVYAEPPLVALNIFHLRNGQIVDRRELFWEDQFEYDESLFLSSLLKQIYLDQQFVPAEIHVPVEFEDLEALEELLTEKRQRRVEIRTPQRGQKKALLGLVETNAKHSFDARFRVLKPSSRAIQEALQDALNLPDAPSRIECFDISHIQGTDKVASMVVWEDGKMKKSDYRKFIIRTVVGNDDFASMREVVTRRYSRLQEEKQPMPGLVLIDGGLGQLHAAAEALEAIGIADQPLASIAKREEIIYVFGQEDEPVVLDRFSPILHLVQSIRDEAHRFAVTFHRSLRNTRQLTSELDAIRGVGAKTVQKLLKEFGSLERVRAATETQLATVVGRAAAKRVIAHYTTVEAAPEPVASVAQSEDAAPDVPDPQA